MVFTSKMFEKYLWKSDKETKILIPKRTLSSRFKKNYSMKAMAQKQMSDFFYHETKETVKIIKYCKYRITNETEDNKR